MTDDELHGLARREAEKLGNADKKQLRFNDIVRCARDFYPGVEGAGVVELGWACDKDSPLYVKNNPMWASLNRDYRWMLD